MDSQPQINDKLLSFPVCPTKQESNAMKGAFILLIVLAHNTLLVPTTSVVQHYFYQFHYFTFFILPFLYPPRQLSIRRIGDYFIRFYIPYFWLFLITFLAYNILLKHDVLDFSRFVSVFFNPEISRIKEITGFHFLWFLPVFCLFSILRDFYSSSRLMFQFILFGLALFVHFSGFMGLPSYYEYRIQIPLGVVQSFYFFPMGIITLWVLRYVPGFRIQQEYKSMYNKWYARCLSILIFTILSFDFMRDGELGASAWTGEMRNIFLSVFFFILIYLFRGIILHLPLLQTLGKYSLEIYLFHVFVYNGLILFFYKLGVVMNPFIGIIVFFGTLFISLSIIKLLKKTDFIQKIFFPKELMALKDVLK